MGFAPFALFGLISYAHIIFLLFLSRFYITFLGGKVNPGKQKEIQYRISHRSAGSRIAGEIRNNKFN